MKEETRSTVVTGLLRKRPTTEIYETTADNLIVVLPTHTASFSGASVVKGITSILQTLSGTPKSRQQVVLETEKKTAFGQQFVDYLIDLLLESSCIDLASSEHETSDYGLDAFYAQIGRDPEKTISDLASYRAVVACRAHVEPLFSQALEMAGLNMAVTAIQSGEDVVEVIEQVVSDGKESSLVVLYGFPYRQRFTRELNEAALEANVNVLYGNCEGLVGRVGPCVIPHNTPCLECLISRFLSNAGPGESAAYRAQVQYDDGLTSVPWPTHPALESLVIQQLVLEISRFATRVSPVTLGGLLEVDYQRGIIERRSLLKVPRCQKCGMSKPARYSWDFSFSTDLIHKEP